MGGQGGVRANPGAAAGGGARIGVMGGTFDPVHHGHLAAASEAGHAFSLDEVIFVPAGRPWQKDSAVMAPAEDRYQMTVLATASNPLFSVSRVDIDRPGQTYTVDTLRDLRAERGPAAEFYFIVGADTASRLRTWRSYEELFRIAHFIGCNRAGHRLARDSADRRIEQVEVPALEISSSMCRERVRAGQPIRYLVPDAVVDYIADRGLYRAGLVRPRPPAIGVAAEGVAPAPASRGTTAAALALRRRSAAGHG